jgi:hypothetical protein
MTPFSRIFKGLLPPSNQQVQDILMNCPLLPFNNSSPPSILDFSFLPAFRYWVNAFFS